MPKVMIFVQKPAKTDVAYLWYNKEVFGGDLRQKGRFWSRVVILQEVFSTADSLHAQILP